MGGTRTKADWAGVLVRGGRPDDGAWARRLLSEAREAATESGALRALREVEAVESLLD